MLRWEIDCSETCERCQLPAEKGTQGLWHTRTVPQCPEHPVASVAGPRGYFSHLLLILMYLQTYICVDAGLQALTTTPDFFNVGLMVRL